MASWSAGQSAPAEITVKSLVSRAGGTVTGGWSIGTPWRSSRLKWISQRAAGSGRNCHAAAYSRCELFSATGRRAMTALIASPAAGLRFRSAPAASPSGWKRRQWTRVTAPAVR
jgi:hypothetical protein